MKIPDRSALALFFWVLLFSGAMVHGTPVVPGQVPGGVEPEADVRFFLKDKDISYFGELSGSTETDSRQYEAATLGAYYRLLDFLKVGAFYRRAYGLRHDSDWAKDGNGQWAWINTNSRGEDFLIADVTPRCILNFLPGQHWIGELKARYYYNLFNGGQSFSVRPGVSYFWFHKDQPFISLFLQYEAFIPLNFGVQPINESWLYLGSLYHFSSDFHVGAYVASKWQSWTAPPIYLSLGGTPYSITTQTLVIGLTGIWEWTL